MKQQILILEPDPDVVSRLKEIVGDLFDDVEFRDADTLRGAWAVLEGSWIPTLVLANLSLEGNRYGGIELLSELRKLSVVPKIPFILMTRLTLPREVQRIMSQFEGHCASSGDSVVRTIRRVLNIP